jgi:hypothetical protein
MTRKMKDARADMINLSKFLNKNEKDSRCAGPCPGVTACFDDLIKELRELGEPCLNGGNCEEVA